MRALSQTLEDRTQRDPLLGRTDMVQNSPGGYVFSINKWDRLDRFLILGSEGGTYYVGQRQHTTENVESVLECIREDGLRVVDRLTDISLEGRAPKNDQAIFVLALCVAYGDDFAQKAAYAALPKVCRIGTHLFQFMSFLRPQGQTPLRGMGRALRRALRAWYTHRAPDKLAVQLTKYRQRHKWSHRDVLRLAHPKSGNPEVDNLFRRVVNNNWSGSSHIPHVNNFGLLQDAEDSETAASLILRTPSLTHEMVPTHLKDKRVWDALLQRGMPMTALIRNLPTLTRLGILTPMSRREADVIEQITDADRLRKARVHPISVLIASRTYASGRSVRGSSQWDPSPGIVSALEDAFYASFGNLPTLDKRVYIGVDVSGSMLWNGVMGLPNLSVSEIAAAMAMCLARMSKQCVIYGFADRMRRLDITAKTSLSDAIGKVYMSTFGRTDCAQPMIHAKERGIQADAFLVITDNETYAGRMHPPSALSAYRRATGIPAKSVVLAVTSTNFTIADPNDAGMLDIAGFDAAVPRLVDNFISGR